MNLTKLLKTVEKNISEYVSQSFKQYTDYLIIDGTSFVMKLKADLDRWAAMYKNGQITNEDFDFLIKSKKDLAEMNALKQTGLAQVELDKLRNVIISSIYSSVVSVLL